MKVSGDPISSVVGDTVVFGLLLDIDTSRGVVFWRRLDIRADCEDYTNTEGIEWVWGHIEGEAAEALLAANKLARSAA